MNPRNPLIFGIKRSMVKAMRHKKTSAGLVFDDDDDRHCQSLAARKNASLLHSAPTNCPLRHKDLRYTFHCWRCV